MTRRRLALVAVVCALAVWPTVRKRLRPPPTLPEATALAHAQHVRILRDVYGVAHVFGETDADAAFGMAWAHAEDDFPTLQDVFAAAEGKLSLLHLSKTALANDYYVHLVGVREEVDAGYDAMPPDVRAVLEGYAAGLDFYAARHPDEADGRIFPITGRDIAAGFVHKLPLMLGLPEVLSALNDTEHPRHVGTPLRLAAREEQLETMPGSNAHALAGFRSTDGVTRLNVNSHQPWEGPVAWYEIQVASNEGWNMTGGTFPGAPFVLHGHNEHLGWAHTVNSPDLIDVYELAKDTSAPHSYIYDGARRELAVSDAPIAIDLGLFTVTVHKEVLRSAHGPVLDTDTGRYAFRYAGIGRGLGAVTEWFHMNKARSFEEWKSAMRAGGIPMFNTAYADRDHVFYVYNAFLPKRAPGPDYTRVLPGDRSDVVFHDYLPWDELPQVQDPPSGFVQTCNSTPFETTTGPGNPPDTYDPTFGIEHGRTNRQVRSLALLGTGAKLSPEDFLAMKFDRTYDAHGEFIVRGLQPILDAPASTWSTDEARAVAFLRAWDRRADESSVAATYAVLLMKTLDPGSRGKGDPRFTDPIVALKDAVRWVELHHGRVDVPLGEVQHLRRGGLELPLGGGPDVLNAAYTERRNGHLIGNQGDSYILEVDFTDQGPRSRSIINYGASSRPSSPHYADQAPLFLRHELKPAWRTEAEVRAHLEREYHPGD